MKKVFSFLIYFSLTCRITTAEEVSIVDIVKPVVESNHTVSSKLFQNVYNSKANTAIAPYSMQCFLMSLYMSSSKLTELEIRHALGLNVHKDVAPDVFDATRKEIVAKIDSKSLQMENTIWISKQYKQNETTSQLLKDVFTTPVETVDFASKGAASVINDKYGARNKDTFGGFLDNYNVSPTTKLLFTSATTVSARFTIPFEFKKSFQGVFFSDSKKHGKSQAFMRSSERYDYYEDDLISLVVLPLENDLDFVIMLPKKSDLPSISHVVTTPKYLQKALKSMRPEQVDVIIPKFSIKARLKLNQPMMSMGIRKTFSPAANLNSFSKVYSPYVSEILQQTSLSINEAGVSTELHKNNYKKSSASTKNCPIVNANHPFIFFIADSKHEMIFLLGTFQQVKKEGID